MDNQFSFVTISYVPDAKKAGSLGSRVILAIVTIDPLYQEPAEVRTRDGYLDLVTRFGTEEDCPFVRDTIAQLATGLPSCAFPYQPINLLRRLLAEGEHVLSVSEFRSVQNLSAKTLADELERKYWKQPADSARLLDLVSCANVANYGIIH